MGGSLQGDWGSGWPATRAGDGGKDPFTGGMTKVRSTKS